MPGLFDLVTEAQDGKAIAMLSREFELSPQQTEAAVTALLPAISAGLKRSTATPEGLGNLLAVMGQQQDLHAMHVDSRVAFAPQGRAAGNDVLSVLFGSPDVSRAVVDQAQQFSGVSSSILKKLLPVIAGMLISGLMGGKSGKAAAPQGPVTSPGAGGGLGDILGQIFGRGLPGSSGTPPSPQQIPTPSGQSFPIPTNPGGQTAPGGDLLGYILSELQKGIQEGRIKPVIIGGGPIQIPVPGGQGARPDARAGRASWTFRSAGSRWRCPRPDPSRSARRGGRPGPRAATTRAIPADEGLVGSEQAARRNGRCWCGCVRRSL